MAFDVLSVEQVSVNPLGLSGKGAGYENMSKKTKHCIRYS